jgi:prepilin-type processing-associated H-X9-DG protein
MTCQINEHVERGSSDNRSANPPVTYFNWLPFQSKHPGGCNILIADGSVTFAPNTIDLVTLQGLATINGRETVSPP